MSFIKDLNNDSMTDAQRHQRFLLVLFAEVIIVVFLTFVTVSDFFCSTSGFVYTCFIFFRQLQKESVSQKLLEAAVIEEHNKVVSISMQTIIPISNAVEAKNINVGKHSLRVANFSCLIAEKMGCQKMKYDVFILLLCFMILERLE